MPERPGGRVPFPVAAPPGPASSLVLTAVMESRSCAPEGGVLRSNNVGSHATPLVAARGPGSHATHDRRPRVALVATPMCVHIS